MLCYKPKHFSIRELVDPQTFAIRGEKAFELFRPQALITIDLIRDRYGKPVTINDWHAKGQFTMRGYRPLTTGTGAAYSQHRLGNAFDFDVLGMTAEEVRQDIRKNPDDKAFAFITAVELDVTWVHIDFRNTERILWIPKPK